jgi:2'-hydroxyisoflavone reductase
VDDNFLLEEKVVPWSEVPLWLPEEAAPNMKAFMFINCSKAVDSGLTFRPLTDTVKDILAWRSTSRSHEELKAGLDPDKEQMLLSKWHRTH